MRIPGTIEGSSGVIVTFFWLVPMVLGYPTLDSPNRMTSCGLVLVLDVSQVRERQASFFLPGRIRFPGEMPGR
jgi:hypothetical protein